MTTVNLLVGLPASGKSTFYENNFSNHFRYSTDDVIEALAKERGITYTEAFDDSVVEFAAEWANMELAQAVEDRRPIVWDQTNLGMYKRAKSLAMIPDHYYKVGYVFLPPFFDRHFDELERRLNSRPGKEIPKSVMIDMMSRYQMPTITEGFDEVHYFNPFADDAFMRDSYVYDIDVIFGCFLAMREYVKEWREANPVEVPEE